MLTKRSAPQALLAAALLLAVMCGAGAGEAGTPPRIPDMLPEGIIMLVHVAPWDQWASDFRQTAPAQILNEPEVRAFLDGPWNRLNAPPKHAEPAPPGNAAKAPAAPGVAGEVLSGVKAFFETVGNLVQSIRDIKLDKPLADMLDSMARGPLTIAVRYSAEDAHAQKAPASSPFWARAIPRMPTCSSKLWPGISRTKTSSSGFSIPI